MRVSTAAATGIVERLVKSGYAVRSFDQNDRRVVNIEITPKGLGLIKKITLERRKMVLDVFDKISEQDRQDYLRILMRIKDILSAE
jgi:DNA-binding MarR family transcriptional regulator